MAQKEVKKETPTRIEAGRQVVDRRDWVEPAHYGAHTTWEIPRFAKAMETKYAKEWGSNKVGSVAKAGKFAGNNKTKYLRLGYTQNPRKVEMAKCGAATTKKRGPACNPGLHLADSGRLKEGFMDKVKLSASESSDFFMQAEEK